MNITLTGSLGNIGRPLTEALVKQGHHVTVISSNAARTKDIEALGAKAAVGTMQDVDFLAGAFRGADAVYLMETMEAAGDLFDKDLDLIGSITRIGECYKEALLRSGVKKIVHLSSIGAHMREGNGILAFHHRVEQILRSLPEEVAIKFMRPVGFYINLFSFIPTIRREGAIISNYGGDKEEPWVSPKDIAAVVAEEMNTPFEGRTVRYIASDEVSPNEVARALGEAIGKPDLEWKVIPDEALLQGWLSIGFNEQVARGFVEMQAAQGNGKLYENYYRNQPALGTVKLADFAKDFAAAYRSESED